MHIDLCTKADKEPQINRLDVSETVLNYQELPKFYLYTNVRVDLLSAQLFDLFYGGLDKKIIILFDNQLMLIIEDNASR